MNKGQSYFDEARLQEQLDKVTELYSKFSPGFEEKVRTSHTASYVFECLLQDIDVFKVLEHAVDVISGQQEQMDEMIKRMPPKPLILSKEAFDKFKSSHE